MNEANSVNDLKARAVEALRGAGWHASARKLASGEYEPAEVLRIIRDWFLNEPIGAADAAAIAAVEALVAAKRQASMCEGDANWPYGADFAADAARATSACPAVIGGEASVSKRSDEGNVRSWFDARAQWVSRSRCAQTPLTDTGDGAVFSARTEYQRALDEAREAGRAEAKVEIERLRAVLLDIGRALDHRAGEYIADTAARVVGERDAAYRSGQEEMRERATRHLKAVAMHSKKPELEALLAEAAEIRSLSIANAPTAPARTGEANPGGADVGAVGAEESVAPREEVARREPRTGDVVLYEHRESASPAPAMVIHVHKDGALDLRVMDTLGPRNVVRQGNVPGTWRFRD